LNRVEETAAGEPHPVCRHVLCGSSSRL